MIIFTQINQNPLNFAKQKTWLTPAVDARVLNKRLVQPVSALAVCW